jgi:hypothetical protein
LVRTGVRSISFGIAALSIWFALKSTGTQGIGSISVGLQALLPGISVFGTIHPKLLDLRMPIGSQIPPGPAETLVASETTADEIDEDQSDSPCTSFEGRFFFRQDFASQDLASFDERFVGAALSPDRVSAQTAALEEELDNTGTATTEQELRPFPPPPFPGVARRLRQLEAPKDSNTLADADAHTAIYDITAHVVYLPDGRSLEAHSGLGARIDDPRYVSLKGRGPTPPNIYHLTLREQLFHGVRALRLVPVGARDMYGRDGILAHSYMLGRSGQSNGCVSFSNYPAFLRAYMNGEVNRLVVVEHLAAAPGPRTASGWRGRSLKDLLKRS